MIRLEHRDLSTEGHTRRVALLAVRVGEELKLSATARRHLAVGGLLHDIGKLAVPHEILRKPGSLTDEEFAAIKRHPGDGRLLDELGGFPASRPRARLRPSRAARRQRLPARPDGRRLSIETRILAVCDVYDALVSDRVYRAAWTAERAFGLLRRGVARVRRRPSSPRSRNATGAASSPARVGRRCRRPRDRGRPAQWRRSPLGLGAVEKYRHTCCGASAALAPPTMLTCQRHASLSRAPEASTAAPHQAGRRVQRTPVAV